MSINIFQVPLPLFPPTIQWNNNPSMLDSRRYSQTSCFKSSKWNSSVGWMPQPKPGKIYTVGSSWPVKLKLSCGWFGILHNNVKYFDLSNGGVTHCFDTLGPLSNDLSSITQVMWLVGTLYEQSLDCTTRQLFCMSCCNFVPLRDLDFVGY